MDKRTVPYELLIRWDADGNLLGGHYQTRTIYTDGAVVVADRIADPVPVALGGNDGFPLAEVLTEAHLSPLATVNAANARVVAALAERDAILAERGAATATPPA